VIKKKLQNGELTVGSWISLGNTAIAEIFAKSGFDWLVIDVEHSVINIEVVGDLIRTIDLCGVAPLVRLTSNDSDQIKRVMDAGAHGVVVPMVNSIDDAVNAVSATRYYPKGHRGVGLGRAQGYGARFAEYYAWQKNGPIVIVQIEHIDALDQLEGILSVEGVDGFIIGPYDLSSSMGIPGEFENSQFVETVAHIRRVGNELGCPSGIHIVEPDTAKLKESIDLGYRFIAYSVDIRILDSSAREAVKVFKETES